MTGSQYRNVIKRSLKKVDRENSRNYANAARQIFNNCGVAFPHGGYKEVLRKLMTDDYMVWRSCTYKQAQECANVGIATVGVNPDHVVVIEPENDAVYVEDTADGYADNDVFADTVDSIDIEDRMDMQFFAYTLSPVSIMPMAAAITTTTTGSSSPSKSKVYLSPENQLKSSPNTIGFYGTERERMESMTKDIHSYLVGKCGNSTIGDLNIGVKATDAYKRRDDSNAGNNDIHIMIHSNAFNGIAQGPQTFYLDGDVEGKKLAQSVLDEVFALYKQTFPNATKRSVSNTGNMYFEIRDTNATAILLETAFHDNPADAKWIVENQTKIAIAIGKGIQKYQNVTGCPTC